MIHIIMRIMKGDGTPLIIIRIIIRTQTMSPDIMIIRIIAEQPTYSYMIKIIMDDITLHSFFIPMRKRTYPSMRCNI